MDKKKELTLEFERYIKVVKNDIKRLEKELKDSRFRFFRIGIKFNLRNRKRQLIHYERKLADYRKRKLAK